MKISILNPAPKGPRQKHWGDFHFGLSLQHALERRGVSVSTHYWPEWEPDHDSDAVIVLRGRRRIIPTDRKRPWLMWAISHPSDISLDEINAFTVVCPASETFCDKLKDAAAVPVVALRQCTDTRIFNTNTDDAIDPLERSGLLFIANSRKVRRQMIQWAANTGMRPVLVGQDWDSVDYDDLVLADYVDNDQLPGLYRQFQLGLNDHWGDMRYYGIISNRVFDCLACGLPVLSDRFPELEHVFGDGLLYADNERAFWDSVWKCKTRYLEIFERTRELWGELEEFYSFDARAGEILELLENASPTSRPVIKLSKDLFPFLDLFAEDHKGIPNFLHVQPTLRLARALSELDSVNFTRVGLGLGPWSVDIDHKASQLPSSLYDGILLDEGLVDLELDEEACDELVLGIHRAMKPLSPLLVVSRINGKDRQVNWVDSLTRAGFASEKTFSAEGWSVRVFRQADTDGST